MDIWDDKLEEERDRLRKGGKRLSFDCFNLKVKGNRVHCAKGHLLGQAKDGTLDLGLVLRGITSGACKDCKDFDNGENG